MRVMAEWNIMRPFRVLRGATPRDARVTALAGGRGASVEATHRADTRPQASVRPERPTLGERAFSDDPRGLGELG